MKQCRYCKAENSDQATECVSCGLSLEFAEQITEAEAASGEEQEAQSEELTAEQAEAQRKAQEAAARAVATKKKKRRIILAAAAGVLAVIILVVVLAQTIFQTNSKFMFPEVELFIARPNAAANSVLIADTKIVGEPVEGDLSSGGVSLDGTVCVLKDMRNNSGDSATYIATKDGFSYLDGALNMKLAVSGKGVVYVNEDLQLYLQTIPVKKDPVLLTKQVLTYTTFAISPNGKSVAYVEEENGEEILYMYQQEKRTKVGSNLFPVAISDNGTYIYCISPDNQTLYLANMQGKLTEIVNTPCKRFILNQDHTQMMLVTDDAKWYVLDHGDKKEIDDSVGINATAQLAMITPGYVNQLNNSVIAYNEDSPVYVEMLTYAVENLAGNYYTNITSEKRNLSYLDKAWKVKEVTQALDSGWSYEISRDGNTLCYIEDNTLYRIQHGDFQNKEQLTTNGVVTMVVTTSDGKAVYYLEDGNLWYQTGTGSAEKLAESVYTIKMTHDDYLLFFTGSPAISTEGSTLYAVKNGGTPKQIADSVYYVFVANTVTYYYRFADEGEDTYELYGTEKGINFKFITKDN